ncbi:hypothetical protein CHLNCDRAFT_136129 [Chlorella variabilis]|uniref:F-box domain-containing protein n=1 Tax=Chlorella variabilis TaxID=554065 RepID=E1ZJT9_CHLVA|nr:hypothetical protein CHLNCDRAFT_136129 [Chlorella variabilis]EFN53920.1 hypothetical protein CHLNCDRAFT_136129 [Chlorella variabilis]|eukprot:XP_005846022.1 hypothetical protein CHLNCDRAFT_136129 [Chlorella variabilis]
MQPTTIDALPDAVLVSIFECIELVHRHRALPLVCRRWAHLANAPELLRAVKVAWKTHRLRDGHILQWLRSLCAWLVSRAAAHVQHLDLALCDLSWTEWSEEQQAEAEQALESALAACGSLAELRLMTNLVHSAGAWVAPLHSLRRLHLTLMSEARDTPVWALHHLTALDQLELLGGRIRLQPGAGLPSSLTSLRLGGTRPGVLTQQVHALASLRSLTLSGCAHEADALEALARLASLRRLEVVRCRVPSCLPWLTSLRALIVRDDGEDIDFEVEEEDVEYVEEALPCLGQLTFLELTQAPRPPEALPTLRTLRSLGLSWRSREDAAMPAGAWTKGLRRLVAPCAWIAGGVQALRAPHLCVLGVASADRDDHDGRGLARIMHWAVQLPSLKVVAVAGPSLPMGACAAIVDAQRLCPGLLLLPCRHMPLPMLLPSYDSDGEDEDEDEDV